MASNIFFVLTNLSVTKCVAPEQLDATRNPNRAMICHKYFIKMEKPEFDPTLTISLELSELVFKSSALTTFPANFSSEWRPKVSFRKFLKRRQPFRFLTFEPKDLILVLFKSSVLIRVHMGLSPVKSHEIAGITCEFPVSRKTPAHNDLILVTSSIIITIKHNSFYAIIFHTNSVISVTSFVFTIKHYLLFAAIFHPISRTSSRFTLIQYISVRVKIQKPGFSNWAFQGDSVDNSHRVKFNLHPILENEAMKTKYAQRICGNEKEPKMGKMTGCVIDGSSYEAEISLLGGYYCSSILQPNGSLAC
ncbi:U5 small nuclear ribonucleoprotein helicase [Striga asiatica]|uniref:U5 small nuclear ribonucleoprotein helicase n=1 Tax=Striga asiatica TaxID=4170 RepID=A0A5A7P189_STRAF|nr:U5 small nuclear ribonucleoprotein helicase [Striga asiatica]